MSGYYKYLKIPIDVIRDIRLTMTEKAYLCLIAQLHNANGCTATNSYLSQYFMVSKQAASSVLQGLKEKGVITMDEKRDKSGNIESRTIIIIDWELRKVLVSNKGQGKLDFENKPCQSDIDRGCKETVDRGVSRDVSSFGNPIKKTLELTLDTLESILSNPETRKRITPPKIQWTFTEPENLLIDLLYIGGKLEKQFKLDRPIDYERIKAIVRDKQTQGLLWNTILGQWETEIKQ